MSAAPRTSETLLQLAGRTRQQGVALREVVAELGGRASGLLIVLMALPFCGPFSIPGFSTPGGIIIALLATQISFQAPLWLPQRLLKLQLSPRFFELVFRFSGKGVATIEKVLRPRWAWCCGPWNALMIAVAGVLLALPLPPLPPFTNMFPAWVILVGMLGMIESDGVVILTGWFLLLLTSAYFVGIYFLGEELLVWLQHALHL